MRIVDALRDDGTASRADIARRTGLSRSTVSTLVSELQDRGLVVEREFPPAGRQGRPAMQLALDPSAGAAVGIDFCLVGSEMCIRDSPCTVSPCGPVAQLVRAADS